MSHSRDLIIIGAGFAGLACARRAAERGLSVLVLDRKSEPGERIHTTGILVKEAWEEWAAPSALVRRINRVRVYTPSHQFVELERDSYHFMATDTARLMDHLVDETRRAGAEVRFGERFPGVTPGRTPLTLDGTGITGRFLVGADGARSHVAESFGLDRNVRLLKGVEWEFEPLDSVGDCLHCFIDPECAPGYIGWVVPGVGVTQVGLAVHRNRRADMERFIDRIDLRFGLSGKRVLEKRGGVIPIGGLLRKLLPRPGTPDRRRGRDGLAAHRGRHPQRLPVRQARRRRHRGSPRGGRPAPRRGRSQSVPEARLETRRPLELRPPSGGLGAGSRFPDP